MTNLPDIMLARTVQRLRAMADAIEAGATLTDLAHMHGISIRVLRRLAVVRPRASAGRRRSIGEALLTKAIKRARDGAGYREIAAELQVNLSTLKKALARKGVTSKAIRVGSIADAIQLYKQGVRIAAIKEKTGLPLTTLYAHLSKSEGTMARRKYSRKPREMDAAAERMIRQAAEFHQQGMKLEEIEARTGIKRATLYLHMHRKGGFTPRRLEPASAKDRTGGK